MSFPKRQKRTSPGPRAVVLLSGGLDSATALAVCVHAGFRASTLTVDYGQRHRVELESARRISDSFDVEHHRVFPLDLRRFGGSALTDAIEVPRDRSENDIASGDIPVTYVPARNLIFLSLALAWAETLDAHDLFIGVNALDYSGYPDCRIEFIRSFEQTANRATREGVQGRPFRVHAPLVHLGKSEIIQKGFELGVDFGLTSSCYAPTAAGKACGRCDSCRIREKGFCEAGIEDPAAPRP
jgi:7-cyano-7-deazaguanine synthase